MPTINNTTCSRCNQQVSETANYCEQCGCCFDSHIGLQRLGAKIFALILAFLVGAGVANYNLGSIPASSMASVLAVPSPSPTPSSVATPSPEPTQQASAEKVDEEDADQTDADTNDEESSISREEYWRQRDELEYTKEALATLEIQVKELSSRPAEPTSSRSRYTASEGSTEQSLTSREQSEPHTLSRLPTPTPTPAYYARPTPTPYISPDYSSTYIAPRSSDVQVNGYFRKDGTYVQPHRRSAPDSSRNNNFSNYGNINPYTGKRGSKR